VTAIRLKQAILRTVVECLWLIPVVIYLVGSVQIIIHVTRTKYMIMLAAHCTGQIMPATKRESPQMMHCGGGECRACYNTMDK